MRKRKNQEKGTRKRDRNMGKKKKIILRERKDVGERSRKKKADRRKGILGY